jgi:hypothetical protein
MSANKLLSSQILTNHALRSQLVFELLSCFRKSGRLATHNTSSDIKPEIPIVLFQFWDDLTTLPEDVRECIDSWDELTRLGFRRVLFDDNDARDFIEQHYSPDHLAAYDKCHHPAMKCDYFRLCFLLSHGGAYIDADEEYVGDTSLCSLFSDNDLKLQPLCYDLDTAQMVPASQFMDEPHSASRIYYFNNNPIVARRDDPIIAIALQRATKKLLSTHLFTDIQATTGPGNMTESLLLYHFDQHSQNISVPRVQPLFEWDDVSVSKWPLSYRNDERNWRNCELPK